MDRVEEERDLHRFCTQDLQICHWDLQKDSPKKLPAEGKSRNEGIADQR